MVNFDVDIIRFIVVRAGMKVARSGGGLWSEGGVHRNFYTAGACCRSSASLFIFHFFLSFIQALQI